MSKQKKKNEPENKKHEPEKDLEQEEQCNDTDDCQADAADGIGGDSPEAQLQKQLDTEKDKLLRLAAEYDNYRKRSQKERESLYADVKGDAVLQILPVYDNLERALAQETTDEAFYKGVEMTMTGLKGILEKMGVKEIPAIGDTFDPELHNAIVHVEDEGKGTGEIVEELQKGFVLGDKVIRFSLVKVAN